MPYVNNHGNHTVFDFPPMLPTLKKVSFQGFGSRLLVNIPFWCWDPTLAHSASRDHFALTTTHPPCSASSLFPLPTNTSILIYVSPLHYFLLFTLLKCDFIGLNRFYKPLLSLSHRIDTYHIITIYVPYCSPLIFSPPFPSFDMSSPLCTLFLIFKFRLYNPVTTYNIQYIFHLPYSSPNEPI